MKETVERVKAMEERFDRVLHAVTMLSAALDHYAETQADIVELERYYDSKDWLQDFAADEAGQLPDDLKRGVLSEDGLWDLLSDNREMKERMKELLEGCTLIQP